MAITFERNALYEEVWTVPLTHLAKKYSLSDNGLRKVCKAMNIPLPANGHWARIAAGQTIERILLPAEAPRSTFTSCPPDEKRPFRLPDDDEWLRDRLAFEERPENQIQFDPKPRRWHSVVRPLREKLMAEVAELPRIKRDAERVKKDNRVRSEPDFKGWKWGVFLDRGQLLCETHKSTPMRVTLLSYERAFAILNAICYQAENRGFSVALDDNAGRIILEGFEGKVEVRITERLDEAWRSEQSDWEKKPRNVKYKVATGQLRLFLGQSWSEIAIGDGKEAPLENKLNEVFLKIYARIVRCREQRRQTEAREQAWKEEERRREELEKQRREAAARREAERRKRESLVEEARAWQTVTLIRAYVSHVERRISEGATKHGRNEEWCNWAKHVADELDPIGKE
jgi:hypothetical protein